jgi:hypothetical protein
MTIWRLPGDVPNESVSSERPRNGGAQRNAGARRRPHEFVPYFDSPNGGKRVDGFTSI